VPFSNARRLLENSSEKSIQLFPSEKSDLDLLRSQNVRSLNKSSLITLQQLEIKFSLLGEYYELEPYIYPNETIYQIIW
jgi:hypothetical protein